MRLQCVYNNYDLDRQDKTHTHNLVQEKGLLLMTEVPYDLKLTEMTVHTTRQFLTIILKTVLCT